MHNNHHFPRLFFLLLSLILVFMLTGCIKIINQKEIIENSPPTAPEVLIIPNPAYSNSTIMCIITEQSYDANNDTVTYNYEWFLNASLTGLKVNYVLPILTSVGDIWTCVVTPYDGTDYGSSINDSIMILESKKAEPENNAPSAPSVHIEPDIAYSNDTLTCTILVMSFDKDNDTIIYFYEWFQNGSPTGIIGDSVPPNMTHSGDMWICVVTPYDGKDYGLSGNASIIIQDDGEIIPENTLPTTPMILIEPYTPYTNDTLQCKIIVESYDADNDTVTYNYVWFRNGNPTGLTGNFVQPNQISIGDEWMCVVTPYDGYDFGPSGNDSTFIYVVVSGTYILSPSIYFICAWGLVNLDYSQFIFMDNGISLIIQPAMNDEGYMTGPSASTGNIDTSFISPGTCEYVFSLHGSFISNETWSGTFKIDFIGICFDCYTISWEITGTRI